MSSLRQYFLLLMPAVLLVLFPSQARSTLPGSSGGSFSVDNSGAARYEVPILVPPGTRGMEPGLSLVYSSRSGNGALGVGWSLKGLSSINRCPAGLKTDEGYSGGVHHDASDDFCLGSQRLIAVKGMYGYDGTEYRTEVESYAKIISHGYSHDDVGTTAPSWFEVLTKDGKRYIYGNSADSRSTPIGTITVHAWLLTRVEDRRGNFYAVTYSEEPETWRQPICINYTGNDRMGITPAFSVDFTYTSRPDKRSGYVAGGKYPSQVLLDTITTSANGEVARTYRLGYEPGELTNRSRLHTLEECGSQGECFQPMRFEWSEGEGGATIAPPTAMTDLGYHATSTFLTSSLVDMNGDGLMDWVTGWRAKWGQVHKSTWLQTKEGTWQHAPRYTIPGDGASVLYDYYKHREEPLKNGLLQDVNGDGLPDWVLAHSYDSEKKIVTKKTWINTGSGWWLDERYTLPDVITDTIRFATGENHGTFVDLNGDGLVDWVTAWKGNYHNGSRTVWINRTNSVEGNVWERDDRWKLPGYLINYSILFDKPGSNLNARLIDVNGDGLPDYVRALKDRFGNIDKSTFLNTGSGWRREDRYTLPDLYIDYSVASGMVYGSFVDVNGDGLVDWVRAFRNPWGHDSMATYLNTGRGWVEDEQYRMKGVIYDYREYIHTDPRRNIIQRHGTFVDFNGDGLVDWLQSYRSRNFNDWHHATWINTGTTWVNRTDAMPPPEIIHDYSLLVDHQYSRGFDHGLFVDIDGDGSKDWVQSYRDRNGGVHQSSVNLRKGRTDLITAFHDEIGSELRVDYSPLTDNAVYQEDPSWIPKPPQRTKSKQTVAKAGEQPDARFYDRYPVRKAGSTMAVVARTAKRTQKQWRTREYSYGYAKYDVRYGWQGFAWIKTLDVNKDLQQVKQFFQDYPLTGRLRTVGSFDQDKMQNYAFPVGGHLRYRYGVNGKEPSTPNSCSSFPCTIQLLSRYKDSYELDSSLVTRETLTNEAFDGFGNITRQRLMYEGNPELQPEFQAFIYKEIAYENRTEEWLLGLPDSERTTFSELGKADRSRLKEASFNHYGEPEVLYHDPDMPEATLTESFRFDDFGNAILHTQSGPDVEDRYTATEYDPTGHHPIGLTNSLGHNTAIDSFNMGCGQPEQVTDPNGLTTTFDYDQWCRLDQQTSPDGNSTTHSYGYDYAHKEYSIRTASDGYPTTTVWYDALGRLQEEETHLFNKRLRKNYTYDVFNRRLTETTPFSGKNDQYLTHFAYDDFDRAIQVTAPDGAITSTRYEGLTTVVTNALNQSKREERGPRGETLRVIDAEGNALAYTYDAAGNLTTTRDPHGNTITLEYDRLGRKIAMQDPDLGEWQYSYNAFGELISQTDGNNQTTTMVYDLLGRMTQRTSSDGTSTWAWDTAQDGIGQLAEARGSEYQYLRRHSYDELGRPSSTSVAVEGSNTFTTNWFYDSYSRLEQVVHPENIVEQYTYTKDGALCDSTISQGQALLSHWRLEEMDDWGNASRETINNELVLINRYDPRRGRIDRTSATVAGQPVQDLSFGWDPIGNLNRRINILQQQEELFDYDRLNRLVASRVNNRVTEVEYDAIGNILWKSDVGRYSYGQNGAGPHAVTIVDTSAARNPIPFTTFNPEGNYSYDNNGNLLSGGGRTIEWTSLNMARRITGSNGADSYFLYGPEGQRIAKDTAEGKLTVYLSEVHELELDADDQATSRLTLPLGSAVAEILITDTGVSNRYLLLDHLGSPEVILDQDLVILEQLSFDPWGKRRQDDWSPAEQTIASSTPTGFTGHEMDDETGLINMAARLYDPLLGRFLSADTMIPNPENLQSFNRYSYVKNNPLRYVDPTGHEEDETSDAYQDDDDTPGCQPDDEDETSYTCTTENGEVGRVSIDTEEGTLTVEIDGEKETVTVDRDGNVSYSFSTSGDTFSAREFGGEGNDGDLGNETSQSSQPQKVDSEREPTKSPTSTDQKPSYITYHGAVEGAMIGPAEAIGFGGSAVKGFGVAVGSVATNKLGLKKAASHIEEKIAGYLSKKTGTKGKTVLGKYPDYLKLAEAIGARRFNVPEKFWNKMTKDQQWAANKIFLDRLIKRGDDIILSNPIKNINEVRGAFRQEVDYLIGKGYRLSRDGKKLIK